MAKAQKKPARLNRKLLRRCYRTGGYLADIPLPHVRAYPAKGHLRRVTATIDTWIGLSGGAKHYYAKLDEDHNWIWHTERGQWQEAWDDREGKGLVLENKELFTHEDAQKWILQQYAEHFSDETHTLSWRDNDDRPDFMYKRDGD